MRLTELVIDGIIVFVAIKAIKIYGDCREAKGVIKGTAATLQTVEQMRKENKL